MTGITLHPVLCARLPEAWDQEWCRRHECPKCQNLQALRTAPLDNAMQGFKYTPQTLDFATYVISTMQKVYKLSLKFPRLVRALHKAHRKQ